MNPFHQLVVGQTGAVAVPGVVGAVKPWGRSPGLSGTGGGVVQPAATSARTANEDERIRDFMESLKIRPGVQLT